MNTNEFRAEVEKIMPGYVWTIQRPYREKGSPDHSFLRATGIQSAGFNRMSTLEVERRVEDNGLPMYEVSIAGYGTKGSWVETTKGLTLARALRSLQTQCEGMTYLYASCVGAMKTGRGTGKAVAE